LLGIFSQVAHSETDIGNSSDGESVVIDGGSWNTDLLRLGYNHGFSNSLEIINGGAVYSSAANIGDFEGYENWVQVTGPGSTWMVTNDLSVGRDLGHHNRLIIESSAVVNSANGYIGGFLRGCNYNTVSVSGGAQWNAGGELVIGLGGIFNRLSIANGGVVNSSTADIGKNFAGNTAYQNSVVLSGSGSRWVNSGIVSFNGEASYLTISNGAEVVAGGGVSLGSASNSLNLEQGGKLTIGTDFDASVSGFNFNAGSTLSVAGNLSGLSEVEFDRRLEAVSVLGSLTVNGTFAPGSSPADSVINGALTMGSNGVLVMELGGYVAGADSDRLTVIDISVLDGTLDISFINSFTAKYGDSFHLFDWQDWVSGTFTDIDAPVLGGGLAWDTSALYTTGHLNVIPEPAVLSLILVAGSFGFIQHHLRR